MNKSLVKLAFIANLSIVLSACGGSGIEGGNQPPSFTDTERRFALDEDTQFSGAFSASDPDGDSLAFGVSKSPKNGTLTVSRDGSFVYVPKAHFFGDDIASVVVSDRIATTTRDVTFVVANINDLPTVVSSRVAVSEIGRAIGQVVAVDYDNDVLTFSVQSQPTKGTLALDAENGNFTYETQSTGQIDDTFIVGVSDGSGEIVRAEVAIRPSFVTNADKRSYYYNAESSHLSLATQLIEVNEEGDKAAISDAALSGLGYLDIAVGYALSGFTSTAIEIIEKHILSRTTKAQAYRDVAAVLDKQSQIALANELREKAVVEYNTYIAEIGIENITPSNALFYLTVIRGYLDAEQNELANKLLTTTHVYAQSLSDLNIESKSAHRAFVGAYLEHAQNMTDGFLNNVEGTTFDKALNAIQNVTDITATVSFDETSRGITHKYRANYYRQAAQLAHVLSLVSKGAEKQKAIQLAKYNLASGLALYTDISYDGNFSLKADPYAQSTLARFDTPLQLFSGLFLSLYPEYVAANKTAEYSGNIAYELIKEVGSSADLRNTHRHLYAHTLLINAQAGLALTSTLNELNTAFAGGDEAEIFHTLVEAGPTNPAERYGAWLLHYAGYKDQALLLIDEAETLLKSEAYQDDVRLIVSQVIGSNGCLRLVELNTLFGGSRERSEAIVATCAEIADKRYKNNDTLNADRKIEAFNAMTIGWATEQKLERALTASKQAQLVATTITDFDDYLEEHFHIANALASAGALRQSYEIAMTALEKAVSQLNKEVETAELVENIDDILKQLNLVTEREKDASYLKIYKLFYAIQHHAGTQDDYRTVREGITLELSVVFEKIESLANSLSENDRQDIYESLIKHYSALGFYEKARSLATDPVYTEADREQLLLTIVQSQATQDEFPASAIANVDTDKDGFVNFFLPTATEQQITDSGLSLDQDSDNDGKPDPEDLTPLSKD
ncbi:Ig-like domain-containing protein [Pseudoalteromonas sp. PPB1]|uniref:Ig-like domain-containing protein n=1 Tax=Pseudoalteromonas sp. PPB1 TaxID=2756136 RepID=UPI0018915A13|nr:Ig-like domain-containing protein [Pseudoalteromonas sp. PPB1]